jgi:hypothetical protein
VNWTMRGDGAQHFLGWHFFRSEPWHFPLGIMHSYGYPLTTSVVFTDSIPLVAIPLKLVQTWLPPVFQYQGLWLLGCYMLQGYFGARLLQHFTSDVTLILLGTLFFLLNPIMIEHSANHGALSSHWIILASLHLYFERRSHATSAKWIVLLLAATMVHFYLLVMSFAVFAAYILRLLLEDRTGNLWRIGGLIAAAVGAVILNMWVVGYFVIRPRDALQSGFTYHSMNLLSPFTPSPYEAVFMKSWPLATPGQAFGYLGFGLMLLAAIAAYTLISQPSKIRWTQALPLVLVSAGLTAFSLSNRLTFGPHVLWEIPLPFFVEKAFALLRASGRLFWPPTYILTLVAIAVVVIRNEKGRAALILGTLACLQAVDFLPLITSNLNEPLWESRLKSPSWSRLVDNVSHVVVVPPDFRLIDDWASFAFLAANHGKTFNAAYFARQNSAARNSYWQRLLSDLQQGKLAPDSLYVVVDRNLLRQEPRSSEWLSGVLDGYLIFTPRAASMELDPWPRPAPHK